MKLSESVLRSLLENVTLSYGKQDLYSKCPWCGEQEFGISLKENHVFNCFRKKQCGETGNIFKLLKKLDRLDLLGNNGIPLIRYDQRLENIIEQKIETEKLDLHIDTITPPVGFKRIYSNFYLENRNFDSFEKYEIGTTKLMPKLKDHVILLVKDGGEIKGYIARIALDKHQLKEQELKLGHKIPRYRNSTTDFTKLLVGYDEINEKTNTVILVEGAFGKENVDRLLKLDQQDIIKCCSTSGAKISPEQIFKLQLKNIKHLILFFDIDVINKIKRYTLEYLNEFETIKIIYSKYKDEEGKDKDPADLSEQEMMEVYNNQIDPIKFYFDKVQVLKLK